MCTYIYIYIYIIDHSGAHRRDTHSGWKISGGVLQLRADGRSQREPRRAGRAQSVSVYIYIYIYTYLCHRYKHISIVCYIIIIICVYVYIYIYIYGHTYTSISLSLYIYIYIYRTGRRTEAQGTGRAPRRSSRHVLLLYVYI